MAWLFVPDMPDSNSDSSSCSETPIALCVTSKGKPLTRQLSWRGWKTRAWIALLSGTISRPSTADRGAASWIASLRASRASRGVRRVFDAASKTRAGCGLQSAVSFAWYDRAASFWKTSQGCLLEGSRRVSETWPKSGSMRSGVCFQRRSSQRRTSVSVFSSWPTPVATVPNEAEGVETWMKRAAVLAEKHGNSNGMGMPLSIAARMWPTPMAGNHDRDTSKLDAEAQRRADTKRQIDLHTAARNWMTPVPSQATGAYSRDRGKKGMERLTLVGQASRWATPLHADGKSGAFRSLLKQGRDNLRTQVVAFERSLLSETTSRDGANTSKCIRVLNPQFVEALMGLPIGWTGLQQPATESFRSWQLTHTRLLRAALNLD